MCSGCCDLLVPSRQGVDGLLQLRAVRGSAGAGRRHPLGVHRRRQLGGAAVRNLHVGAVRGGRRRALSQSGASHAHIHRRTNTRSSRHSSRSYCYLQVMRRFTLRQTLSTGITQTLRKREPHTHARTHCTPVSPSVCLQVCDAPSPAAVKAWLQDTATDDVINVAGRASTTNKLLYMNCVAGNHGNQTSPGETNIRNQQ